MRLATRCLIIAFFFVSGCSGCEPDLENADETTETKPARATPSATEVCGNGVDDDNNGLVDEKAGCWAEAGLGSNPQVMTLQVVDWDGNDPIFSWEGTSAVIFGRIVCVGKNSIREEEKLSMAKSGLVFVTLPDDGEPYQCQAQGYNLAWQPLWSNIIIIGV